MTHKSGFVNIIGNPNVGKSTLMNALVGEKVSIITSRAQTTRHRIQGIVNGQDFQIVYSDTPGIIDPHYRLQEKMRSMVQTALDDADIIVYVTDVVETPDKHTGILKKLKNTDIPVILVLNKADLGNQETVEALRKKWEELLPRATFLAVSALYRFNLDNLFRLIMEYLPEGEPYYPKDQDQLTDKTERFMVAEMIRKQIFTHYQKEVPYSVEVEVDTFKEEPDLIRIAATIHVSRESQKGILIGRGGIMLKKVGTAARKEIEKFFQKKVFLEMYVKVTRNWRDEDRHLRKFGYY
ncbi:MAG TPA: GTPase Era [Bacteroidetes bacterium]|nr:GTPase Era [Bacteroidota bacterium]